MAPEIVKRGGRQTWLEEGGAQEQSMNPKHCLCAHYQFYHVTCRHAAGRAFPFKCGATENSTSGRFNFCKKPAPQANVDVTKAAFAGKCKACRTSGYGSLSYLLLLLLGRILTGSFAQRLAWKHPRMPRPVMNLAPRASPIRHPARRAACGGPGGNSCELTLAQSDCSSLHCLPFARRFAQLKPRPSQRG